ncbi:MULTISPECIES: GntR family transcriptional regulator [unclassified Pseudonocardia]|uniref:GntR family transcriptional regulator n=1 Tax=unclassified Pseudonocardia TaxID=2619320 RepID=UPI0001FFF358|nr:GntR family transcriptional regulator [Pseudonocardia sp. Ae707_Ps1]OLM18837.1 Transcriptional regulator, GntR family [Pseudonocardia sp. Ae707_Ps1]
MATRSDAVQIDVRLDRSSPVPLYHQLAQAIETAIDRGALQPGDRLENEITLTERLGLARPTARQAIQELVRKGLLVRRRGLGTQVVRPAIHRDVRLTSLYEDLTDAGRAPETRLLAHEAVTPATSGVPALRDLLPADEPLQMLRRLRRADGEPLSIMTNYLPARFDLADDVLAERGLYALLREQGAQIAIAHQTIGARLAHDDEAALLERPAPLACVTAELTVYDDAGALVELGRHLYRADRYTVQTSLVV